jgi:hypothetical protein
MGMPIVPLLRLMRGFSGFRQRSEDGRCGLCVGGDVLCAAPGQISESDVSL